MSKNAQCPNSSFPQCPSKGGAGDPRSPLCEVSSFRPARSLLRTYVRQSDSIIPLRRPLSVAAAVLKRKRGFCSRKLRKIESVHQLPSLYSSGGRGRRRSFWPAQGVDVHSQASYIWGHTRTISTIMLGRIARKRGTLSSGMKRERELLLDSKKEELCVVVAVVRSIRRLVARTNAGRMEDGMLDVLESF